MKPGFIEYNTVTADACQILAIAEIQYEDSAGAQCNIVRSQQCRTLRITLGNIILETGRQFQTDSGDSHQLEEAAIAKLKSPLMELIKKLPSLIAEMKIAADSGRGFGYLAKVLFCENADWSLYNINRLQNNLALLVHQERDPSVRPRGYNSNRIVTNIFMQPQSAIECESRANVKLAELIAARIEQTMALAASGQTIPETHPGLLSAVAI
ncbi:MAG: hypothetical protein EYC62_02390 [Alphaproteobacteria bacterium]|nr:MAG: hypothetical protein EYC62_02390 [Alphaproteobacteria bacterium]